MSLDEAISNPGDTLTTQVEHLAEKLFGEAYGPNGELYGMKDTDLVAPNFHAIVTDPANTLATLVDNGKLIGFSLAVPIGKFDTTRTDESSETAYIYFTGLQPESQGQGLVGDVLEGMDRKLIDKGYKFIERHAVLTQDWADKIERHYKDAIVGRDAGTWWPEVGPQRFFRIDLSKIPAQQT